MKIPRSVNGRDLANYLIRTWSFREVRQTGSHIILRSDIPVDHSVSVPAHKPVKTGTLKSIIAYVATHKGVTVADILRDL